MYLAESFSFSLLCFFFLFTEAGNENSISNIAKANWVFFLMFINCFLVLEMVSWQWFLVYVMGQQKETKLEFIKLKHL